MKRKLLWRCFVLSLPCIIVASCGGDDDDGGGDTPDAGALDGSSDSSTGSDTSSASDANTTNDASDAGDGGTPADAAFDAYDAAVSLDDAGTPSGPTLLLTDTTANRIDLLSLTGAVLEQYPAPVQKVTGVSHDRRARNGFFVIGRDTPASIVKVSWAGATVATINNQFTGTPVRGLDHWRDDAGADGDMLAFEQHNGNVESVQGIFAVDAGTQFSMGFYNGAFQAGYYGISMLNFSEAANEILLWAAHTQPDASTTIERWRTGGLQATIYLPSSIKDVRGLARGTQDDFWVVDGTNKKVVHVNASGVVLDSFATPGTDPGGLSFDPGF